ncbi:MAG TPA: hypothetical protein VMV54_00495, partial [Acidocella sp.]|nr:hypothetical protein [Acidocella sp.]
MADAIGVICTAITDASRWASFRGDIILSENKTICIGSGSAYENRGLLTLGGPEPQKTPAELQRDKDKAVYAAALRPM